MEETELFDDCVPFKDMDGNELLFVRYGKPDKMLVWDKPCYKDGAHQTICKVINIRDVDVDTLKDLKVWDNVPSDVKEAIHQRTEIEKTEIVDKMDKVRRGRRKKYPGIPREATCTNCGETVKWVAAVIAKKVDKLGVLLDDYIKTYMCQKCNPTPRGRKSISGKPKSIPNVIHCTKCKAKVTTPYAQMVKRAEKLKMNPEDFVKQFQCQKCKPTKGRAKGKK